MTDPDSISLGDAPPIAFTRQPRLRTPPANLDGAALVVTLLVIAILTLTVIAFLQSMTLERLTSRSFLSLHQAEQAAEAGAAEAMANLARLMVERPWHAIGYREIANQTTPIFIGNAVITSSPEEIPLVSGPPRDGMTLNASNSVDLNVRRNATDSAGWIGSPCQNGTQTFRPHRAPWRLLLRDPALPNQPDPGQPGYNPAIARYAWWVEDETARLDISVAGNADAPGGGFLRSSTGNLVTDLDVGALPLVNRQPLGNDATANASLKALIDFRNNFPHLLADPRILNRATGNESASAAADAGYHATTFALSNELAGTGRRRANLNAIVTASLDNKTIAADLDDIAWIITGKHLMKTNGSLNNLDHSGLFLDQPDITGPMPQFGSRFSSTPGPDPNIYLRKLAANIRDYIDPDSQPTVVDPYGAVIGGSKPQVGWPISGPKPQAIGKEAVPFLQEHAWRGFIESWSQSGNTVTATLRFDHFFELYNPATKDWTAPNGTFLKVYNLPTWAAGTFPNLVPPDFEIDLTGITVPAGRCVVVTTDTVPQDTPGFLQAGSLVERRTPTPADAVRIVGAQSNELISGVRGFQLEGRSSSITDYRTEFLIGTFNGVIDTLPALSISLIFSSQWNITNRGSNVGSLTRFLYSSSLQGNDRPSRSGDPRSLSEQIEFKDYEYGGNRDQTHFYGNLQGHSDSGSASIPGTSTMGGPAISWVNPAGGSSPWPDYHIPLGNASTSNAWTAYAVIRDGPMLSIGELGHIYDPHRKITDEKKNPNILHARGGGRTLRVGQIDDLVPANRSATGGTTGWTNAAWRLADLFCAMPAGIAMSPPSARGKLNLNSVARDGGVAFRAALRSFRFSAAPDGDPVRAGVLLTDSEIDNLTQSVFDYLRSHGPMMERGELSQIPFFSGSGNLSAGTPGSTAMDRSREEIFRRVVELVTTRSLSFSVYAAGESVEQRPDGSLVTRGRVFRRFVYELEPLADGLPIDSAPAGATATSFRIRRLHEIAP